MLKIEKLRIHGDNIVECTRALDILRKSLEGTVSMVDSPPYAPIFRMKSISAVTYDIQLVPGYGRWGFSFPEYLRGRGAKLREATDAIITRIIEEEDNSVSEEPVVSFEFCGALPAGNNAWQRTGRALASAQANLPYLYYAEIGGLELGTRREAKAPRWPNPLVPFAYVETGDVLNTLTVPIYTKSPTAPSEIIIHYMGVIDRGESYALLKALIEKSDPHKPKEALRNKALQAVKILAAQRNRNDTLKGVDWDYFQSLPSGRAKIEWLISKGMKWNKKLGLKKLTSSFRNLLRSVIKIGCVAPGAQDMPFCVLPASKRLEFANQINRIYGNRATKEFLSWLSVSKKHLVVVWIAGFKPRGDDSRPDRGLVPLARMIFGFKDVDVISVVYGPAKQGAWDKLQSNPNGLADENGLWETIIRLSDGLIVDSTKSQYLKTNTFLYPTVEEKSIQIKLKSSARLLPQFGEQDIDTVLHIIFTSLGTEVCFEGMCNPPGGDWSGMSFYQYNNSTEYRWTSLPRVTGSHSKRPDHVIQIENDKKIIIAIESKDTAEKLEENIGHRLSKYVKDLLKVKPSVERKTNEDWKLYQGKELMIPHKIISCGAFKFQVGQNLSNIIEKGNIDLVIAVEFHPTTESVTLHFKGSESAAVPLSILSKHQGSLPRRIKIQIH